MEIQVRTAGNATILDLNGPFTMADTQKFRTEVRQLFELGTKNLAINMSSVPFLDSSGIGAMVGALSAAKAAGARLKIFSPSKPVLQVLKMVRLDTIFDLKDDEASVLASF